MSPGFHPKLGVSHSGPQTEERRRSFLASKPGEPFTSFAPSPSTFSRAQYRAAVNVWLWNPTAFFFFFLSRL